MTCRHCNEHDQEMQRVWRGLLPSLKSKMEEARRAGDSVLADRFRKTYNRIVSKIRARVRSSDTCKWATK